MTNLPTSWDRAGLEELGMEGFVPLSSLGTRVAPKLPGIYVVLRESDAAPIYRERSVAGSFKGMDSTVESSVLEAKWVSSSPVLYIGKRAGDPKRMASVVGYASTAVTARAKGAGIAEANTSGS